MNLGLQKLKLTQMNANGVENKKAELEVFLQKHSPDIICISETHLRHESVLCFQLDDYNSFHFCRKNKAYGGSAIFTRKTLDTVERTDLYDLCRENCFELSAVDLILSPVEKITVCNVYRTPPKVTPALNEFLDNFESLCSRLKSKQKVVIAGDFNIDLNKEDSAKACFLDIVLGSGLVCTNDMATRGEAILDNVLVKNVHFDSDVSVQLLPFDSSDHSPVCVSLPVTKPCPADSTKEKTLKRRINYYSPK